MIKIGAYNELTIVKEVDFGLYLDGIEEGEILLPRRYVTDDMLIGDKVTVFLYFDSEDRLIATTQRAKAEAGEFTSLKVIDTNQAGAFLDWGLPKDLLVPFNQQKIPMKLGYGYVVYVYQDDISDRLVASSKLDRFLDREPVNYRAGEKVDLLIADKTDLGFKAIINNKHWGVLFESEVFGEMGIGKKCKGYIRRVRDDGKIDLSMTEVGYSKIDGMADRILQALNQHQGYLQLSDKSAPDKIAKILKMSKGNFKKAIGQLYRKSLIDIEDNGIRLKE
ncbi:S1 RNA-binding domain-containing protein [Psychromonas antarctica]|jgi:predicted RNA-binding protein (virulence factor B family)|uniref:CvfB family protein n=1 Tax=Psychromonas antarctica TaxID=67573 RepID=UPI001EE7F351|nr:S1-like domain-containing RNA-binding protein [Psychromonas antarctica]MCG6200924.1 S1-like domain-containing RNA-binding protein [Psychromonas antarctica]